jgi:hypothetical protein
MNNNTIKFFAVCVAASVVALAVGAAAPASAAPAMSGHYIETSTEPQSGRSTTSDWYFTPCGDGCADMSNPATGGGSRTMLVNGQWTMDTTGATVCPDGTKVPNAQTVHYTWDPSTLAGTARITEKVATCGASAPESWTNNIQLRQAV